MGEALNPIFRWTSNDFACLAYGNSRDILRNENKIKPEKMNYAQEISKAQITNFRSYLIYVPNPNPYIFKTTKNRFMIFAIVLIFLMLGFPVIENLQNQM
jgi:hypothetical protein